MKAALITGAGRRIGRVIAKSFATSGWRVILHYNQSHAEADTLRIEIESAGGSASLISADLSSPDSAKRLVEQAFAEEPGLELLINNASSFGFDQIADVTAASLHTAFAVNAVAPILIAQSFAQCLPADRTGAIIMMLDNRIQAPNPDYFSYGISKFAALGATRMLALALAPRIRVNGIAPGITLQSGVQSEGNFIVAHRLNPLQRGCTPGEIAAAALLIASSPGMTGSIITIDGGQALANPGRDVAFIATEDK